MTMASLRMAALAAAALAAPAALAQGDDMVGRGRYLVNGPLACGNCHTPRGPDGAFVAGMELAGGVEFDGGPAFKSYSRNLTPDADTGLGNWTDEEIIRAIREGKNREGLDIGPPMPIFTYNNMSDDDAKAVVAYLRSLPAVRNEVEDAKYNIPIALPGPAKGNPAPPKENAVAYGAYIVTALAHCFECHTPANPDGSPDLTRVGGGGFPIEAMGMSINSANITPHETGIGQWTDAELKDAIVNGMGAHESANRPLFPIMPSGFFKNMTDEDVNAVIAFLRTVPPVANKVERVDWRTKLPPRP